MSSDQTTPEPTPARQSTLRQKLRYGFDQTMSRGTIALIGWLAVVTLLLVVGSALILALTGTNDAHTSFFGRLLFTFSHALDPAAAAGDEGFSWSLVLAMFLLGLAGLFIVSALIGVIATALDERLAELRKGRSGVIEDDHTLILGWSDAVFTIISELAIANESRHKPAVVILADMDKVEMEDAIRSKVPDTANTRVVCRTGSPIDLDDLEIVNHQGTRSIVILAPVGEDSDTEVIKTVLALTRGPNRREAPYHIVAEIQDPSSLEAARLVAGDEAVIIDKRETIARLIVQTARQSGAAAVYTELFDFGGDEIYFHKDQGLSGKTYGDALLAYEDSCVIGLEASDGTVTLNPAPSRSINGDRVVLIAEDDSRLASLASVAVQPDDAAIVASAPHVEGPSRVLIIGWNERARTVIHELDEFVAAGSQLVLVSELGEIEPPEVRNLAITTQKAPTTERASLETLGVTGFEQIIVLCYSDELEPQRADARTLVTLLHLRDMLSHIPFNDRPTVVSEMLDDRNRTLAQVTEVDDVIVSDQILSLILTQISENPQLEPVFKDLLGAGGSEIYLRPAEEYVPLGTEVTFATLVAAARRRDETALGFRTIAQSQDADAYWGIRLNPPKSATFTPAAGDRIVVLAEE